jgi:hypothetical protein
MAQVDAGREMVVALEGLVDGSPAVRQHALQKALARGNVLWKSRGVEGWHLCVKNGRPPCYCGMLGLSTAKRDHGSANVKNAVV